MCAGIRRHMMSKTQGQTSPTRTKKGKGELVGVSPEAFEENWNLLPEKMRKRVQLKLKLDRIWKKVSGGSGSAFHGVLQHWEARHILMHLGALKAETEARTAAYAKQLREEEEEKDITPISPGGTKDLEDDKRFKNEVRLIVYGEWWERCSVQKLSCHSLEASHLDLGL